MSVLSDDFKRKADDSSNTWRRFRHALAERLDALIAYPARHAVSEQELRRVDEDIRRCRQLMFNAPQQQRNVKLARVALAHESRSRG